MAFQVLKGGMDMASSQVDQNFNRWISVANLKHYFNVNSYVVGKLILVLWPWRHRPWTRQQRLSDGANGQDGYYLPPRDDINSPDMYIPLMALITYILLSTLLAGLRSAFHPELFGTMATKAIVSVAAEILLLKAAMYLWLNISSQSQLLDLIAYSGYKFVGVIVTLVVSEIWNRGGGSGGVVGWMIFLYTFSAVGFFLVSYPPFCISLLSTNSPLASLSQICSSTR
jgi:protein transport protein YIF1